MNISPIKDLEPIKIIDSLVNSEIKKEVCDFEIKLEKPEIDSFLEKFEDNERKYSNKANLSYSGPSNLAKNDIDDKVKRRERLEKLEKKELLDKNEKTEKSDKPHLTQHRGLKKTEKMININKPASFFEEEKGKNEGKKTQRLFSINILEKVEELSNPKN